MDQLSAENQSHYGRLWDYFRNPQSPQAGAAAGDNARPYRQAQEVGLPSRITGTERCGARKPTDLARKEVVIENDIGWRVGTMVDFLFGKKPSIRSLAADATTAATVEKVVDALLEANGGHAFLQEMAMLGSVYGFVDVALRGTGVLPANGATPARADSAVEAARGLQLEAVEAPRVLPILEEYDYRRVRFWVQRFHVHPSKLSQWRRPWMGMFSRARGGPKPTAVEVVEVLSPTWWQRYEDRALAAEGPNALGRVPIVHVQNLALTGSYAGLSDVEPLVPLQDELNTRLSDRAQRVTYQSFRMYLGKGIDDFLERPVGPGQMWATQNLAASIEEFGADSGSPSEDAHIQEVRAAMDKVSSVSPLAAGLVQGNVGYLTSATALKVLLGGLLARTARKRLTYGQGLAQIVDMALDWLDRAGVQHTTAADRRIEIHWPNVVPTDESEMLRNAQIKAQLGLPREQVLAELGYSRDQRAATSD